MLDLYRRGYGRLWSLADYEDRWNQFLDRPLVGIICRFSTPMATPAVNGPEAILGLVVRGSIDLAPIVELRLVARSATGSTPDVSKIIIEAHSGF